MSRRKRHQHQAQPIPAQRRADQKNIPSSTERVPRWSIHLLLIIIVAAAYLALSLQQIGSPFNHVSEDTNGMHGIVLLNLMRFGYQNLHFGEYTEWLTDPSQSAVFGKFYAHHPNGFLIPTAILYQLFGPSETTTRLGPLILTLISIIFLYVAIVQLTGQPAAAFLVALTYALLPGTVYYGKHLDMTPPGLAFTLITLAAFILHVTTGRRGWFVFTLASIVLGGLMSWHYYLILPGIFLILLIPRPGWTVPLRRWYLALLPLITAVPVLLNLYQIYVLNGASGLAGLWGSFGGRSGRQPLGPWLSRMWWTGELNINPIFFGLACLGLLVYAFLAWQRPRLRFLLPLFLLPFLTFVIFQQWSTHPFGIILILPAIAVLGGLLLGELVQRFGSTGMAITVIVLAIGLVFTQKELAFFYDKFTIIGAKDIELLKQLAPKVGDGDICEGKNEMGLYYGGITAWYLRHATLRTPECFRAHSRLGLIFNPNLGPTYKQETQAFIDHGFTKVLGCAELWCLLEKPNSGSWSGEAPAAATSSPRR